MLIVWTRLIFPNGSSLDLDTLAGADQGGYAGLRDKVDRHLLSLYGIAILVSAIGASTALISGENNNFASDERRLEPALRESFGDGLEDVSAKVIDRGLGRQPTLKIRPGKPFIIVVDKDVESVPYVAR